MSVAMEATQLAAGGASADDEVNATQPPVDADTLESTQPADYGGKACAVRACGWSWTCRHGDRITV